MCQKHYLLHFQIGSAKITWRDKGILDHTRVCGRDSFSFELSGWFEFHYINIRILGNNIVGDPNDK